MKYNQQITKKRKGLTTVIFSPKKSASLKMRRSDSSSYITFAAGINPTATANADSITAGGELLASIAGHSVLKGVSERTITQTTEE